MRLVSEIERLQSLSRVDSGCLQRLLCKLNRNGFQNWNAGQFCARDDGRPMSKDEVLKLTLLGRPDRTTSHLHATRSMEIVDGTYTVLA